MEGIILAGGKAERLGEAAGGRPKALVDVAGRPLAAYQVEQLRAAAVDRVLVSCAAGFAYEGVGRQSSPFAGLPETSEPESEPEAELRQ